MQINAVYMYMCSLLVLLQALMNTVVDSTKMFRSQVASVNSPSFTLPSSLMQLPLLILSLLKNVSL